MLRVFVKYIESVSSNYSIFSSPDTTSSKIDRGSREPLVYVYHVGNFHFKTFSDMYMYQSLL